MNEKPQVVCFWDPVRGREDRYDFRSLRFPAKIREAFELAFRTLNGAIRANSRRQAWFNLLYFAAFLREDSRGVRVALSEPQLLLNYRAAVLRQKILRRTGAVRLNLARRMIDWLAHNVEDGPWRSVILLRGRSFVEPTPYIAKPTHVDAALVRRVASICKREIDQIINDFECRERLEHGQKVSSRELGGLSPQALRELIAWEGKGIYTKRALIGVHKHSLTQVGLQHTERFRSLTTRTALPYYLLLMIQTCGNPSGIRDLEIDCLQLHPNDPLRRRLFWDKYRASREQAFDVFAEGRYSAARCVQDLLRLTTPLRHIAVPADVHKLMITRTGNRATRLCTQGMYNLLVAFREEHALPFFNFADLRKGAAAVIDQYTQSTKAVRKALQHRRTETSRLYLWSPHSIDRRYEGVLKFQGQMVTLAREQSAPRQETVTGMKCLDPRAGLVSGSVKGKLCLQWLECCRCPNAIIVYDDPVIVARIVRAAMSLKELAARATLSADLARHFETVFRPTLHVIETRILPKIPKGVREKAAVIAKTLPDLPLME
jgi:hypothetical protein